MFKNNKGFMLVEVIITSTVILTGMVGLYTTFNKLYKNYNIRSTYYNIDGIYATKEMFNNLMNNDFNKVINHFDNYGYLIENSKCIEIGNHNNCSSIVDFYGIDNMIIVNYNKNALKELKLENETFNEYIDFVIKYYDINNNDEYSYIFLTEMCDKNNCYYSNLRVR